ncbi:hypothetical protein EUGRSUZ_G03356 [Eucalyptus grandis]|uniref:Uncharacterized protein n=1 Tax=Eucalyptus grandis TaxID=71139 RepID=A0ACC3K9I1_EUCGR|nr:hypothetical protein EUGRSUZ_G03356 [Eucalyptus grandis]
MIGPLLEPENFIQHVRHVRVTLYIGTSLTSKYSFTFSPEPQETRPACVNSAIQVPRTKKMSGAGKVVGVTGGSGYIASWLVKHLLHRGYTVRATIRDPTDPKKTGHLLALEGTKERLHLFKAELLQEGCFDSVVDGCECVFHTASPCLPSAADPQAEIIDPALKGTLNVLRSCAKASSVKRVVVTSSTAAVAFSAKPLTSGIVIDETWYSDPEFCKKSKLWYMLSKTLAEKAAWEFAKENGIDLVTINPGYMIGPILQPSVNFSVEIILNLINGAQTFPNTCYRFVDVRDVAHAHILAFENHSAHGRYCLVAKTVHCHDVLQILRNLYPTLHLPKKCEDEKPFSLKNEISTKKAEALGVDFTPLEVSLRDTVECLKEKGFISV